MLEISVESAATLFLRPDETAASFLSRSRYPGFRTTIPFLDRHLTSRQGTVLEIVGPSGAGKSALLYVIAAISILIPQLEDWEHRGGRGTGSVLFFDLNCKFDMQFMLQILRQEVKSLSEKYNLMCQQEEDIITRALKQLKVIPCPSSFHFLAALNKVERHRLTNAPTLNAYIMVDDLSAHFQVDRVGYGFSTSNSTIKSTSEQKLSSYQNAKVVYASIMRKLNNLQRMLEAPIILTTRAGTEFQSNRASGKAHSQPWHEEVTHSIQMLPATVNKDDGTIEGELDIVVQWLKPFDPNFERLRLLK